MLVMPFIAYQDGCMELQQLRYVVAVAEEQNFTRAAAKCFVVQSALSHQVKALEGELGFTLFARTSRKVELTAAGEAFLPAARESLRAAERAAEDAAAATGVVRGRLSVGVIPTVTAVDVPGTLRDFRLAHPQVQISLQVSGSEELIDSVAAGGTDIAFLGMPRGREPAGVAWRHLLSDRHVALVSTDHRLAGKPAVSLDDLADETFADFPRGGGGRAQTDLAFDAAGISRDVAFEVGDTDFMLGLVRQGLAVTLLPSRFVRGAQGMAVLPVVEGPCREEFLIWSAFNPRPAGLAYLDLTKTGGSAPASGEGGATTLK